MDDPTCVVETYQSISDTNGGGTRIGKTIRHNQALLVIEIVSNMDCLLFVRY
jgi:hypothetical protein